MTPDGERKWYMGKIIQVTPQMKQAVKEIMDIAKGSRDYFGVKSYLDGYDLSVMKTADAEQIQKLMDNIEYIVEDMRIRSKIVILTDHIRGMTRREEVRMPQKTHRNNVVTLPCAIGDLVYQALYTPMSGYFVREGKIQKISVIGKGNDSVDIKLGVFQTDDQTVAFIDADSIGKSVFFTEEEAKEAIESLEEQLEAFQDEKEPDFDEWWENLDDIEREEYNRWCQESELE